jgi:hypothetical protein
MCGNAKQKTKKKHFLFTTCLWLCAVLINTFHCYRNSFVLSLASYKARGNFNAKIWQSTSIVAVSAGPLSDIIVLVGYFDTEINLSRWKLLDRLSAAAIC